MSLAITLDVVRVFVGPDGAFGNRLGVFHDGKAVPDQDRQAVADHLGFSETVFVDDRRRGEVRLFTPRNELPFAGHPLVGAAWLLRARGWKGSELRPPAGAVPTWVDESGTTWIRSRPEWVPACSHQQVGSPADVMQAQEAPAGHDFVQVWAWQDERRGVVRARTFAPREGVQEDEACGMASLLLTAQLGRRLTIHHGEGSLILARPTAEGTVEIGGRVSPAERRLYHWPAQASP